jgi:hypothetical protein
MTTIHTPASPVARNSGYPVYSFAALDTQDTTSPKDAPPVVHHPEDIGTPGTSNLRSTSEEWVQAAPTKQAPASTARLSDSPDNRSFTSSIVQAAREVERIELVRGPKRRFEYLIPARVGEALAEDAARRGVSAATRLLEILRDSGYPVIPEDLIDLRKLPKR